MIAELKSGKQIENRRSAVSFLGTRLDPDSIEVLIHRGLSDLSRKVREEAIYRLTRVTGRDFRFVADDPPETRAQKIDQWKTWWKQTGRKRFENLQKSLDN